MVRLLDVSETTMYVTESEVMVRLLDTRRWM